MNLVQRVVPAVTLDEQVAGILEGQRYLHSLGITAWQEAIVGEYAVVPDCFDAYREVERPGPADRPGHRCPLVAARGWAVTARFSCRTTGHR